MRYRIQNKKTDTYTDTVLRSEKGMVLVVSLLLLLVATVVGVTALSTSTTNVMISGNQRLSEICFAAADSGVSVSMPVIEAALAGDVTAYSNIVNDDANGNDDITFVNVDEADDTVSGSPDLTLAVGSATVNVDVDYVYAGTVPGCAIEFAISYDDRVAGDSCIGTYYAIRSAGTCEAGAESEVCAIYRDIQ